MARIIRSAKTLLSPTSETPTSPITADLVRPTPSPLPSDLAVPSLGHDGVYGYDLKGKKAASPLHVPVPTENTGKFIPLMKKLSRDSSKSKKSSLELSPQTVSRISIEKKRSSSDEGNQPVGVRGRTSSLFSATDTVYRSSRSDQISRTTRTGIPYRSNAVNRVWVSMVSRPTTAKRCFSSDG